MTLEIQNIQNFQRSQNVQSTQISSGVYKNAMKALDEWLDVHKGETFDLDIISRQMEIHDAKKRQLLSECLFYKVKRGILEKSGRLYKYIDNTIVPIDWVNASDNDYLSIQWPYGVEDGTQFGFDDRVRISPGDIIVIAGVSNMGKTSFCLNFLWENMDNYPCTLMGNEYTPGKFKRRVSRMTWREPLKEDGTPKFELIERREGWKDIIRPNNINIIDWINLGDKFYEIGKIIEGIQSKLHDGIALISIQKNEGKSRGLGGGFSEHLASLYLTVDFERLTIVKAKEWHTWNPNGKMYGFEIIDSGAKFNNIRQVKKCPTCWGTGTKKNAECEDCHGKGFVNVDPALT